MQQIFQSQKHTLNSAKINLEGKKYKHINRVQRTKIGGIVASKVQGKYGTLAAAH